MFPKTFLEHQEKTGSPTSGRYSMKMEGNEVPESPPLEIFSESKQAAFGLVTEMPIKEQTNHNVMGCLACVIVGGVFCWGCVLVCWARK